MDNTLQLHGRYYDVITGKPVTPTVVAEPAAPKPVGKIINDVVRGTRQAASVHQTKTTRSQTLRRTLHVSKSKPIKPPAHPTGSTHKPHHVQAHKPEGAKTLMRRAVLKPTESKNKYRLRVHAPVDSKFALAKRTRAVKPAKKVDSSRQQRAKEARPSHLVTHFKPEAVASPKPKLTPIAVQKPTEKQKVMATSAATATIHAKLHKRMLEEAVHAARSHEVRLPAKAKHRSFVHKPAIIAGTVVLIILLGTFLFIQNMPRIDVRLASMHAGFSAKLPGYQPASFTLMSHVQSTSGHVTMTYQAGTDQRQYTISQQTSNWDNQTLRDFAVSTNQPLAAWQQAGQTYYKYGNHLAWVNAGIWYQITDHAELTNQQLLDIATSM